MKLKTLKEVVRAKRTVEERLGMKVDKDFANKVFQQCVRKCKCTGKAEDYIPLMYTFELPLQLAMSMINETTEKRFFERREKENVQCMFENAMSSEMS